METAGSLRFNNPPSDPNALQRMGSNMPSQERNEDICFNSLPSEPNTIRRMPVGSSSMPAQET